MNLQSVRVFYGVLQLGSVHLHPRRKGPHGVVLHFTLPDSVATECEQRVPVLAAEADARHATAVWNRENDLRGAVVGTDLNATTRGDELAAFQGVARRLGTGVVVPVGH